jgi:hypothetical protein
MIHVLHRKATLGSLTDVVFILCNVFASLIVACKILKHILTFRDAIGIGGNAPRDALASDDSRARLLKNPPYETTRVVVSARITVGPATTVRSCIFILFFVFVG